YVNGIYVADFDAIQAHGRAHTHSFNLGKIRAQTVLWPQEPAGATGDVKDSDRKDDNPHEHEQSDAQLGPAQLFALRHGRPLLDSFLCIVESTSSQKVLQVPIGCVQNGALVALKINAAIAQHYKGRWRHGNTAFGERPSAIPPHGYDAIRLRVEPIIRERKGIL